MKKLKIFENDSAIVNKIYKQDGRVASYVEALTKEYGNVVRWDAVNATNSTGSTIIIYRVECGDVYDVIGVVLNNDTVRDCTMFGVKPSSDGALSTDGLDSKLDAIQTRLTDIVSSDKYNDEDLTGFDMVEIIREIIYSQRSTKNPSVFENMASNIRYVGDLKRYVPEIYNIIKRKHDDIDDDDSVTVRDLRGATIVFDDFGGFDDPTIVYAMSGYRLYKRELDYDIDGFMDNLVDEVESGSSVSDVLFDYGFKPLAL